MVVKLLDLIHVMLQARPKRISGSCKISFPPEGLLSLVSYVLRHLPFELEINNVTLKFHDSYNTLRTFPF